MLSRLRHKGKADALLAQPSIKSVSASGEVNLDKEVGILPNASMGSVKRKPVVVDNPKVR